MELLASNLIFKASNRPLTSSSVDCGGRVVARVRAVELDVSSVIAASATAATIKEPLFRVM
jgi:hypothetical protein